MNKDFTKEELELLEQGLYWLEDTYANQKLVKDLLKKIEKKTS